MSPTMNRLLFYSHDSYGLGNIRRTLSICQALSDAFPALSTLVISGSPMIHKFPMPPRVDCIRLPCPLRQGAREHDGEDPVDDPRNVSRLRAELIRTAAMQFKPDVVMVNRRPSGVKRELEPMLHALRQTHPDTKLILLLRDILDNPTVTRAAWEARGYHDVIRAYYDRVLVLGQPDIFDPREEYAFPHTVSEKVEFCGYIRREGSLKSRNEMRDELGLQEDDRLILVTAGGGIDGYAVMETYVASLSFLSGIRNVHSLILTGPEMPEPQRRRLRHATAKFPRVLVSDFTSDMMSYMSAADVVVSMGGYGTVCEILSLEKPAIVIPRASELEEQRIRAERMGQRGLFHVIHPNDLSVDALGRALRTVLMDGRVKRAATSSSISLDALPYIARSLAALVAAEPDTATGRRSQEWHKRPSAVACDESFTVDP